MSNRIAELRKAKGLTLEQLAQAAGTSNQQVSKLEKGKARLTVDWMIRLAKPLGVSPRDLMEEPASNAESRPAVIPPSATPVQPDFLSGLPSDVPVYGVAAGNGNADGSFRLEHDIIDYVKRLPGIAHARDVYALYVSGDSMEPVHAHGDLIYVSPSRPALIGDDVVIHKRAKHSDHPDEYLLKRLERRNQETIFLRQFNPNAPIDLPMTSVLAVHKVLKLRELIAG